MNFNPNAMTLKLISKPVLRLILSLTSTKVTYLNVENLCGSAEKRLAMLILLPFVSK
jgi:hypothetical protein